MNNDNEDFNKSRRKFMASAGGAAGIAALAATGIPSAIASTGKKAGEAMTENKSRKGPPTKMPGLTSYPHAQNFSVTTVGTGSPIQTLRRARSSTIVQFNGRYFLIDCGNGSSENLFEQGYLYRDIHSIMFTHLHYDHTTDYVDIWMNNWVQGNKHINLVGPPRTKLLHDSMTDIYRDDIAYRMFRIPWADKNGIIDNVDYKELTGDNSFELHGVKISTTETVHSMYNLAYKFEADGKSIVISGDTGYTKQLSNFARGADIFVLDASIIFNNRPAAEMDLSRMPTPSSKYEGRFDAENHITLDGTIKMLSEANPKKVVLTHFNAIPSKVSSAEIQTMIADVRAKIAQKYSGEVIFAEDMMEINPS